MKRSTTQIVKRGGEWTKVQLKKNGTINTSFSLPCGRLHQDKKEGGFQIFLHQNSEKNTKITRAILTLDF